MPDRPARLRLQQLSLQALLILALSIAATLAAWRWTSQQGETLEAVRFEMFVDEAVSEMRERMEGYNQLLLSGAAFLRASDDVTRDEWRRFFGHLELDRQYPGTQGVGFAVRVTAAQWAAHESMIRAEGFPGYTIKPAGPRPLAFPIQYIEPFSGRNLRAFGYDMFSEPIRHEAMVRARDTGLPALSGKVVLVQETSEDVQPGVLLYLPYYGRTTPDNTNGRRNAIIGFIYSPLRMGDLARGVLGTRLSRLCVQVYDQAVDDGAMLFGADGCQPGRHRTERRLDIFGREWIIRIQSTPQLDGSIASTLSKLILGAGAAISVLLMWAITAMLAEHRRRLALDRALAELEVARAEAAGASAAKGRFLAAASHDLRQPLQSLGIYLHLLIDERAPPGPVESAARQAYEATTQLVEAMFDAAALESGQAKPVVTHFDIADLIERIAAESRPLAEMRGLRLRHRTCHAQVQTDQVMLERLLRNLVSNAIKYTAKGGVLIACRPAGASVSIKVADSGPGIPADKQQLIFEDLYQLDNPQRDPRKGLGLGLATVARLARLLGYRLHVHSRVGIGSTFVVEIPRVSPTSTP
jgi:signal transduction histidine kinase